MNLKYISGLLAFVLMILAGCTTQAPTKKVVVMPKNNTQIKEVPKPIFNNPIIKDNEATLNLPIPIIENDHGPITPTPEQKPIVVFDEEKPVDWYDTAYNLAKSFEPNISLSSDRETKKMSSILKVISQYQRSESENQAAVYKKIALLKSNNIDTLAVLQKRQIKQENVPYAAITKHFVTTDTLAYSVKPALATLKALAQKLALEVSLNDLDKFHETITIAYHENTNLWDIINGELDSILIDYN